VRHVRDELTALCDGALDPAERSRVEAHLARCAECRAARDRIAGALAALSRLPPPPAPSPGFEQRFYARLARQEAGSSSRRARLPWRILAPLAAAGAAAAIAAGLGLRERRQEEFLAAHLDLFESYEAVASVDDVSEEDAEVVAHLHELEGRP
jgi:anti-sigma factor RsiW